MNTLFLAWQDTSESRAWFPIGKLEADQKKNIYTFTYTQGALEAQNKAQFKPLASFPDFHKKYESSELFPLFKNRVLSSSREDFLDYIKQLDLAPGAADPLEILAISEGRRMTDNLQVFPKIMRGSDGSFHCKFFLHGWRHVCDCAKNQIDNLQAGSELRVSLEMNNPVTGLAIQLSTQDYHMIGWSPRYLVIDLVKSITEKFQNIKAKIVRINPEPAPTQQRILVELSGNWPEDYEPMSDDLFREINQ